MQLPLKVDIVEVGPRDGFQNLKDWIPTEVKIKEIEKLIAAGINAMEITSFVHPKAIPQMADAMEVASDITERYNGKVRLIALVPNARGAENACKCGIHDITYVISASEAHNKANVNRTIQESLDDLKGLAEKFPNLSIRLDIATAFDCPFDGKVDTEQVIFLADQAVEAGVKELILCDTIGTAGPRQVAELSRMAKERYKVPVGLHLHDTRGMGLANILAGMQQGITIFETAAGGLGGCPFAPGAAGNTATEDLLNMLETLQIETGVDLNKYMDAVSYIKENIQPKLTGHMINVCNKMEA